MEQVCFTGIEQYAAYATAVITGASVLANAIDKETWYGKLINFLAVNIKLEKGKK